MSLTILVHRKMPQVAIIKWYRDPKFNLEYPSGQIATMPQAEFESTGCELVHGHFEEYAKMRVTQDESIKGFQLPDPRKFLKSYYPIQIGMENSGAISFSPLKFQKYDLSGLRDLGPEARRTVPKNCSNDTFWEAFELVLNEAKDA